MHHLEIVSQLEGTHLEQLPELIEESAHADGHEPIGEHKFLRLRHGPDLGLAVLAYEDRRLAGYAHTLTFDDRLGRRVSCELVVRPEFRRRGVGRMLLSHALMHAASQRAGRIDVWAYNDSPGSRHLASQFGFTSARELHHLHRHTTEAAPVPAPPGTRLRTFRPGEDEERWLALNNRIFAGHPENGSWTLDDLRARLAQPWFDAGDFLMLEHDGEIAGYCWLKIEERGNEGRVGEIYVIGVAEEQRGRGHARYLLSSALEHLRARGAGTAAIYVDATNTPALALYQANGFHHHHIDVCYTRAVRADSATLAPPLEGQAAA